MNEEQDWLDELLRAERAGPVPDGGFVAQVMSRLPSRNRIAPRWLIPAAITVGLISAIVASGTNTSLASALQLLVVEHRLALAGFLPVVLVWGGCAWALSESQ